ncbi:lectin-like domain-containing protein [Weissella tructae]|uniref:DUF5978 domain-containing protein n=1 Tax=Weissella tructae TaxID=887702 RepID=UPI00056E475C|nr:Ig-like domain-containing protein [Weissella tructae]
MRFKMYKAGKIWVFSAAVLAGLAVVDETNMVMGAQINIAGTQELSATKYLVEITKENFSDYFDMNGSATYDQESGIVTLTEKKRKQSGNVKLKEHFNPNEDFLLQGGLNLGDNSNGQPIKGNGLERGGDGVGFVFHPGDINQVGNVGGAIGIGGIVDGFGFKFDTYWNGNSSGIAEKDPEFLKGKSFGSFVYNDENVRAITWEDESEPWSMPKQIDEPSNNEFKDVVIDYRAATGNVSIVYDGQVWTRTLRDFLNDDMGPIAFGVAGSTGTAVNLQQFRLDSLSFYELAENPKIHQVELEDTVMTGTGHPGDEFEVKDQNGNVIGSGLINSDGTWEISVPKDHVINPNDDYTVFANKPGDKTIKRIPDTTTVPNKVITVPTIPVDEDGNEIPVPDGMEMPKVEGKPGDKKIITPDEVPDIPGYEKPKEPIEVVIPDDGASIEIPYEKLTEPKPDPQPEKKEVPTIPVDEDGNKISVPDGVEMPKVEGKPGDKKVITPDELPDIPGYEKPKEPIEVVIPDDGASIEIPYEKLLEPKPEPEPEKKEVPTIPVDEDGNKILVPDGVELPKVEGKPGDKKIITPDEVPDIPGYEKPKEPIEVVIPDDGSPIEIPYEKLPDPKPEPQPEKKEVPTIPVDEDGNKIPVPDGVEMPKAEGKPGDTKVITPDELPDIPGYEKPKESIEVVIPDDGSPIEIPYEKLPDLKPEPTPKPDPDPQPEKKEVPTIPVDEDGNKIPVPDGVEMPKAEGKPGDKKVITPDELPDIPGYEKPKEPIEVVIPDDGSPIEIPYEKLPDPNPEPKPDPQPEKKEVPTIPVDKDGNKIPVPDGVEMPKVEGKPGDKKVITPDELPDIPGYEKPKEPIEVVIPDDGSPIEIPYEKQPDPKPEPTPDPQPEEGKTPTIPVDKDGNKIPVPDGVEMPKVEGNPGDKKVITPDELPDIPGYEKPKEPIEVVIPDDGSPIAIPYEKLPDPKPEPQPEKKEVPTIPVDKDGNKILAPDGVEMPKVEGKSGDKKVITPDELPDVPGYEKPKEPIEVVMPDDGSPIEIPYEKLPKPDPQPEKKEVPTVPVDKDGNKVPVPDGVEMPKVEGKSGDKKVITPDELPDIPGYEKPKEPIEIVIPDDGSPIEIPYTEKKTPSVPVDKETGKEIKLPEGEKMPEVPGKPGDVVEIDINDLPDIPGYDKPTPDENGKIKITVPEEGKSVEIPYTEKKTPSVPVDEKTGEEIKLPEGEKMPEVPGNPGEEVEIDINDLPDIPGYDKPTPDENGKIKVQIPKDGGPVQIPYTEKKTPSVPVDKETGKEIKLPEGEKMPEVPGKPGDVVEIDINDLPDIPGYDKPTPDENGKIKITVPEEGKSVEIPYTEKKTPSVPVDKETGKEIKLPEGEKMPEVPGKPGDVVEIDINDLPDIPGYDKPTPDENGKIKITVPEEGKSVEIPYTEKKTPSVPVDKETGKEIKLPEGEKMPEVPGKPGDVVEIDINDLPDIPGYDKPTPDENGKIKITVPEEGKSIEIPYTEKKTPSVPVDKETGKEIKLPEGEKMPEVPGKPGDVVEIDINDLPDIPGYDKPTPDENGKIKITVPEEGKSIEIPYTEKKTPSRPVDKNTGKEIKTDKSFPSIKGKPGDMVEIDINDLPDIPGFSKPKADKNGKIKVQIPEDGKPVEIPYQPDTQSRPVDKNTGKEIKTDKNFPTIKGHPGDVVEVDVNDLPEIPGYNKPKGDKNGKIKVTIPENGMIDFGYTPIEAGKPGQPEQNNNGSKNTPENKTPEKGKSKGEASYPNTGSETNVLVSALGAAMLALTGLFAGLTKLRKK